MYLGVVLNPLARRNRKDRGARARRLRRLLGPWGEVHETPSIDALSGTLEGFLPRATHLVSDGGDGALHWMINTVRALRGEDERWPTFVPTNGGTIDFVARKVGVRGRSESIVRALTAFAMAGREPEEVTLDSLLLTGALEDGTPFDRVGFALAAGGVGNRFFDKYYADPAPSPTTIAKVIGRTVSEWTAARVAPTSDARAPRKKCLLDNKAPSILSRPRTRSRAIARATRRATRANAANARASFRPDESRRDARAR